MEEEMQAGAPIKYYKACDRCRSRKRGCDGLNPCKNCIAVGNVACVYSAVPPNTPKAVPFILQDGTRLPAQICDACRSKKRKCDALAPYCTNCVKSKVRDENGDPVCTYSWERKKRAKTSSSSVPGDTVEAGPSSFVPAKEASSSRSGKKRASMDSLHLNINTELDMQFVVVGHVQQQSPRPQEGDSALNMNTHDNLSMPQNHGLELGGNEGANLLNYMADSLPIFSTYPLDMGNLNPFTSILTNNQHNINMIPNNHFSLHHPHNLEQHLFQLAQIVGQAVPLSISDKHNILSNQGVSSTMCRALKYALFASASMFSIHSSLHPSSSSAASTSGVLPGVTSIALKQRIEVARQYASRSIRHVNNALVVQYHFGAIHDVFTRPEEIMFSVPFESVDISDLVRSMLCLAHFSYGIGEGETAVRLIQELCHMSNILGLFTQVTKQPVQKSLWSVDSLIFRVPTDSYVSPPQSVEEEQERFHLWASCLVFDTYCSMESGNEFALDERLYPEFVAGWRPKELTEAANPPSGPKTRAADTVWQDGPYADMFDIVAGVCLTDLYPHSTSSTFNYIVWICVILRRIMRVARSRIPVHHLNEEWWKETLDSFPDGVGQSFMQLPRNADYATLHNSLIVWFSNLPDDARAFSSLEIFADRFPDDSAGYDFYKWSFAAPALEGTLLFLSSFAYLHVGSLDSSSSHDALYPLFAPRYTVMKNLKSASTTLYSSRTVLLACLRAVCFLLKRLMDRERAASANSNRSADSSSSIPSPVQYWSIQPLELFVIASTGLLATRVAPVNKNYYDEALDLVVKFIIPTLDRFCRIWPIGTHYKSKLQSLIDLTKPIL